MAMPVRVVPDVRELERFLTDLEQRTLRSVAASSLTTVAREARTGARREIQSALAMPSRMVGDRLRVFRATPKTLVSGVYANTRDVPEIDLGARQKGHPGARRKSNSADAARARLRRKRQGAKPSKPGGVTARGRSYPSAWIGTRRDGKGGPQVFHRTGSGLDVHKRAWGPALAILRRHVKSAEARWAPVFLERLRPALERRGQGGAARFLESTGNL